MESSPNAQQPLMGTKKRHLPTSEFAGKFESKADFVKFFRESRK